ncbi:hypothetical protein C8J57DRAFT_1539804 [Mycena rebaudengoi]|nr:hypothetical protein C8J57DRAFT_1539804 [Mycena rebaudengoi]
MPVVFPVALRGYPTVPTTHGHFCWGIEQVIDIGVREHAPAKDVYHILYALQWTWPVPLLACSTLAPTSPKDFDIGDDVTYEDVQGEADAPCRHCFKGTDSRCVASLHSFISLIKMKPNPAIQNLAGNSFASFSAYFLHKLASPRQVIRLRARAGVFASTPFLREARPAFEGSVSVRKFASKYARAVV